MVARSTVRPVACLVIILRARRDIWQHIQLNTLVVRCFPAGDSSPPPWAPDDRRGRRWTPLFRPTGRWVFQMRWQRVSILRRNTQTSSRSKLTNVTAHRVFVWRGSPPRSGSKAFPLRTESSAPDSIECLAAGPAASSGTHPVVWRAGHWKRLRALAPRRQADTLVLMLQLALALAGCETTPPQAPPALAAHR